MIKAIFKAVVQLLLAICAATALFGSVMAFVAGFGTGAIYLLLLSAALIWLAWLLS